MFILIGVEGSDGKIYSPDPYDIRKEVPEVVTYFDIMVKHNRVLRLLDNYNLPDYSPDDYAYILLPAKISDDADDEPELFHDIKEFQDMYGSSNESIYVIPDPDNYDDIISICDIVIISSVNMVPKQTIEYNGNVFNIENKSSELTSKYGYKYYHSTYIKEGIKLVELV